MGTQYRSAIFYHSSKQKEIAEQVIAEISAARVWDNPIITDVQPYTVFYKAEDYHQNYFLEHTSQPYCQVVIAPKVAKFRKLYFEKLQAPV